MDRFSPRLQVMEALICGGTSGMPGIVLYCFHSREIDPTEYPYYQVAPSMHYRECNPLEQSHLDQIHQPGIANEFLLGLVSCATLHDSQQLVLSSSAEWGPMQHLNLQGKHYRSAKQWL